MSAPFFGKIASYDAIVRTYNASRTLARCLASLRGQSIPPERIIVIDSASTDDSIAIAKSQGAEVWPYGDRPFNFSRALNLGIDRVTAPACLVVSCHVILKESDIADSLLQIISDVRVPAAYVDYLRKNRATSFVDKNNFDGFNGLWNPCAMYRIDVLRQFLFDEAVPAAEDQHLASRLFAAGFRTGVLKGPLLSYENPHKNSLKWRHGYVSVAYFSYRKNLSLVNIGRFALSGIGYLCCFRLGPAYHRFAVAARLFMAKFRRPRFQSRYFKTTK